MEWQKRKYAGLLTKQELGTEIHLCGWIDTIRDHGQLLFAHLRDIKGVVQLVFNPDSNQDVYKIAETLRNEDVVSLTGTVVEREDEAKNDSLPTGHIELHVSEIILLNKAKTPPFILSEKSSASPDVDAFNVDEDLRLKYRYLDLRRPSMQHKLIQRYKLLKAIRDYLDQQNFIEIETPVLTKSTPEGARDYLVPSRVHQNKFYALPQSPQLFKQLLMMSGMDRYFQIVKCFRDEDLRPNRQPEFTQLDLEASFIDESFIYSLLEGLVSTLYKTLSIDLPTPFPHLTYEDAINSYGTDAPDLRFELKMMNLTPLFKNVNYKIFKLIHDNGGLIKAINVKGQANAMSKSMLQDELAKKVVPSFGAKGMTWMKVENGCLQSNVVQFFSDEEQSQIMTTMNAEEGDVLLFIADTNHALVNDVLGRLRLYVANKQQLIEPQKVCPCWITEFPLFELKDGNITSIHHPFTQPDREIHSLSTPEEILAVKSRAYDLVINGEEVGGGSIRIHDPKTQSKIFELLGLSPDEINSKFGFFVDALNYGTPPHGGLAIGIDRLVSMMLNTDSIREVIAFPKNRTAFCPLTQAPSTVSDDQLKDLYLKAIQPIQTPVDA